MAFTFDARYMMSGLFGAKAMSLIWPPGRSATLAKLGSETPVTCTGVGVKVGALVGDGLGVSVGIGTGVAEEVGVVVGSGMGVDIWVAVGIGVADEVNVAVGTWVGVEP